MFKMGKKKDYTLLIIICLILFSIVGLLYFSKSEDEEQIEKNKYVILNDYSRFFTVNSCVYKYIQYLSNKNYDNLFKVLSKEYINDNNINESNIYNYLPNLNGNYSFVSKKIYYEKKDDNYFKYYVYGYIEQDLIDSIGNKEYYYFLVDYDQMDNVFSITPINKIVFDEVENG